jgi:hypothetical protein
MWGVGLGVFTDADCTLYVPVLTKVMNQYYNGGGGGDDGGGGGGGDDDATANDVYASSIGTAVRYINQAYQAEVGCGNNADTCASLLGASSDFDTCSANSFFFGELSTPWSAFTGTSRAYQISQNQLQDSESTCAAVSNALEDTSSPAYSDYLQTLERSGGVAAYSTVKSTSAANKAWGVIFIVLIFVLLGCVVLVCKTIRVRRVTTKDGKQTIAVDVLRFRRRKNQRTQNGRGNNERNVEDVERGSDGILMRTRNILSAVSRARRKRDATHRGIGASKKSPLLHDEPVPSIGDDSVTRGRLTGPSSDDTDTDCVENDAIEYQESDVV